MLTQILFPLFERDLNKLKKEILLYSSEENLWIVDKDVSNCAGNLCLHIVGNLNHFIGAILGNTGYTRERDKEFSLKNVPRTELLYQVDDVLKVVEHTLLALTEADLKKDYSIKVFEDKMTTGYFLVHLSTHLAYHLGQINYHRRLLDS